MTPILIGSWLDAGWLDAGWTNVATADSPRIAAMLTLFIPVPSPFAVRLRRSLPARNQAAGGAAPQPPAHGSLGAALALAGLMACGSCASIAARFTLAGVIMSESNTVLVDIKNAVATVTLNRPAKRNA